MKTKLFTRNYFLGILMALVLAFGVQGIVDAVTTNLTTTRESTKMLDIRARQVGSGIGGDNGDANGISFTVILEDTEDSKGDDDSNTIETVTVSTSNIQLTAIASGTPLFTRSVTFSEATTTETQTATRRPIVNSVQLAGYFISPGKATLTIRYTDLSDSQTTTSSPAQTSSKTITHTYTYYVVQPNDKIPETTTLRLTQNGRGVNSEGYITGLTGREDFYIFSSSGNYPVKFTQSGSTARLYTGATAYSPSEVPASTDATPILSSATPEKVWLDLNGDDAFGQGNTNVVTVDIGNESAVKSSYNVAYIIGTPKLAINLPDSLTAPLMTTEEPLRDRYRFTGGTQGTDAGTITATVGDGTATLNTDRNGFDDGTIGGVLVKFELKHKGSTTGNLRLATGTRVDAKNNTKPAASLSTIAQTFYVRTDSTGQAAVTYKFGTLTSQEITVSSVGLSKKVTAEIGTGQTDKQISVKTNEQQSGNPKKFNLVALMKDGDGEFLSGETVTFSADAGTLTRISSGPTGDTTPSGEEVKANTDALGEVFVVYDIGDNTGRQEVRASFTDNGDRESVTFVVNGPAPTTTTTTTTTTTQTPSLTISTTGEGTTRSVTVTATNAQGANVPGLAVDLSGTALPTSQSVVSGTPVTITLPTTPGTYTLQAIAPGYTVARINLTVVVPPQPGTLSITLVGAQANGQQAIQVNVRNAAGASPSGTVTVTLSGAGISRTVATTNGSGRAIIALPTAAATLTASATGYTSGTLTLPARTTTTTTTTTVLAGEADSIEIDGSRSRDATLAEATRLRVRVLDANDRGVSEVSVTFRVLNPGRGTFAGARGSGRAIRVDTDRNGYATVNFTPTTEGNVMVEAKAAGVSAAVTFILDVGEATADAGRDTGTSDSQESCIILDYVVIQGALRSSTGRRYEVGDSIPRPSGINLGGSRLVISSTLTLNNVTYTCVPPTPTDTSRPPSTTTINPVVKVKAANRPPMLWVDSGKIYALVGEDVQEFAPSVDNALNIAVAGNKVYWTEKTGESAGTINTANLDSTGVKELKSIMAVPMGITVDTDAEKLYWTNSRGRIQSANLDGSGIKNVLQNLSGPMDIAVSGGNLYWTQYDARESEGSVGIANATGSGTPKSISTGSDMPGSLVIHSGKVYWTEMTGTSAGTVNSANLNGSGAKQLASIRAIPMGIAVDGSRSKLYWTNSRGRVQSANLNGSKIQNVVDGLGMPGDMVLSNSLKAPTGTTTQTPTASKTYDVNGDGKVDNTDASLVSNAMGTDNKKYDVNGDGTVNFFDLMLVFDNRDAEAAAAPTIVGIQLSSTQIAVIEEQIDLLIATGDRSPAAMRTLIYLQQLIATARPDKTQLLANYPNPFNPETWIPYELATDTDVRITIYNAQGVVIRTLQLGQQSAGYYTDRQRAAHWDGRNALGEQVASGIYFYQLQTDEMSSLRKMVILK